MGDKYERFTLLWAGHSIEVGLQDNWLHSNHWHIELRCAGQLPVTQTGYRSRFVASGTNADKTVVQEFVTTWLDTAAQSPKWLRYIEDSKQLKLF
jgi:hypothetical protein